MAKMIPAKPDFFNSKAEERIFRFVERDLPNDWVCLYSIIIAETDRKRNGEVDFVLVGPPGLFCLEVKGGRIRHASDGRIEFINAKDQVTVKTEGPFEQVIYAYWKIIEIVETKFPDIRHHRVSGYGVVTPDTEYNPPAKNDYIRDVLFDSRSVFGQSPFLNYVIKMSNYWTARLESQYGKLLPKLTVNEIRTIVSTMNSTGYMSNDTAEKGQIWESQKEIEELTARQIDLMRAFRVNQRIIVRGSAGTGKTVMAMEMARIKCLEGKKVLYCCYNRNLSKSIEGTFLTSGHNNIAVVNIHSLMSKTIQRANIEIPFDRMNPTSLFKSEIPRLFMKALEELGEEGTYDVLIIDEAQDILLMNYILALAKTLKGNLQRGNWYVFLDPFQNLYKGSSAEAMDLLSVNNHAECELDENCRNTVKIGESCKVLSRYKLQTKMNIQGPDVRYLFYSDDEDQLKKVSSVISNYLDMGMDVSDIVILSKYTLDRTCFIGKTILKAEIPIEEFEGARKSSESVRFSTVHSFKGLESTFVILSDMDDLKNDSEIAYVGTTRAKSKLVVLIKTDQKPILDDFREEYANWKIDKIDKELGG